MIARKKTTPYQSISKQRGFILLEVLIAVIVILGLTIWWVKAQNRIHKEKTADVITQQINTLFNAAANFYTNKKSHGDTEPWAEISMKDLYDNGYITKKNMDNPYGNKYTFRPLPYCVNPAMCKNEPGQQLLFKLELYTNIPKSDYASARRAIIPIVDSKVIAKEKEDLPWWEQHDHRPTLDKNMVRIIVDMNVPHTLKNDPFAVHYMTIVKPETLIYAKDAGCGPGNYQPQIYTAVSSCVYMNNKSAVPLNGCQTYALRSGDSWRVHMRAITPDGVHRSNGNNEFNNFNDSRIQVTLKCKRTPN